MNNVIATASGGATANYGFWNVQASAVRINHSLVKGTTSSIYNGSGTTTYIGDTQLDGAVFNAGTIKCARTYNGSFVPLGANCQ